MPTIFIEDPFTGGKTIPSTSQQSGLPTFMANVDNNKPVSGDLLLLHTAYAL